MKKIITMLILFLFMFNITLANTEFLDNNKEDITHNNNEENVEDEGYNNNEEYADDKDYKNDEEDVDNEGYNNDEEDMEDKDYNDNNNEEIKRYTAEESIIKMWEVLEYIEESQYVSYELLDSMLYLLNQEDLIYRLSQEKTENENSFGVKLTNALQTLVVRMNLYQEDMVEEFYVYLIESVKKAHETVRVYVYYNIGFNGMGGPFKIEYPEEYEFLKEKLPFIEEEEEYDLDSAIDHILGDSEEINIIYDEDYEPPTEENENEIDDDRYIGEKPQENEIIEYIPEGSRCAKYVNKLFSEFVSLNLCGMKEPELKIVVDLNKETILEDSQKVYKLLYEYNNKTYNLFRNLENPNILTFDDMKILLKHIAITTKQQIAEEENRIMILLSNNIYVFEEKDYNVNEIKDFLEQKGINLLVRGD